MAATVGFPEMVLDRAAGVIVGGAVGDALGAGYEYGALCPPEKVAMRPGALTGRPAGAWTDDTDMALGIAQVVATGQTLEPGGQGLSAVAEQFLAWYRSVPPDIGNQTRAVLSAARRSEGPGNPAATMTAAALAYQEVHPEAAGNGSLMRTGPVALSALGDDQALVASAVAVSSLTHPHPLATEACVLWCVAIDRAVREARLDGIWEGIALLAPDRRGYWQERLEEAAVLPIEQLKTGGFVVTTLQGAWRAIVSTEQESGPGHLEAALRAAVAIGGDTDTVAAIAGALLGARYGAAAVPFGWRRHLQGWPSDLRHPDLVALGVRAKTGGQGDNIGWPLVDDLAPYYRRTFHPSGQSVELPGHPGVLWGDIEGLAEADAASFVSLCRIGTGQRRGEQHHQVWLMDNDHNADLPFVLSDTADAVETLRQETGQVFVHCVRAESRTPTVAAAWLVRHRGLTPDAALAAIHQAMPAHPNTAMVAALSTLAPAKGPA